MRTLKNTRKHAKKKTGAADAKQKKKRRKYPDFKKKTRARRRDQNARSGEVTHYEPKGQSARSGKIRLLGHPARSTTRNTRRAGISPQSSNKSNQEDETCSSNGMENERKICRNEKSDPERKGTGTSEDNH